jgi:hypothetical protein
LLYSLEFLSCTSWLVYATRSRVESAQQTRNLILNIKKDVVDRASGRPTAQAVIERVLARLGESVREVFAGDPMLVPVPGSGLTRANTVWPAKRVCQELVKQGLGADVLELVKRITAVPKSAGNDERPTFLQHYESLAVSPKLTPPSRIILIDDVVTSGTTLMACAERLIEALPGVPVAAFAISRTLSTGDPVDVLDVRKEGIRHRGERCVRE